MGSLEHMKKVVREVLDEFIPCDRHAEGRCKGSRESDYGEGQVTEMILESLSKDSVHQRQDQQF